MLLADSDFIMNKTPLSNMTNDKFKAAGFVVMLLIFALSFVKDSKAAYPRTIPIRPCDFYGTEEIPNSIKVGSVVAAVDPAGIIIARFTVIENGKYGFLSCSADDPDTPEDEGAVSGDIVTFYIDWVRQQKQAVWKSGETIRVDLGVVQDNYTFNLHLLDMPGYTNIWGDPNFSGVAVADMIIDYLVPVNTDGQESLMTLADINHDFVVSVSELERLLNQKVGGGYNFGSTTRLGGYANMGIIDQFNPTNQADCIKQICHWLAYKIPNVPAGREYVPVAISTSADPAINADSDYSHWMSVVGIKTNQDPFPNLSTSASFKEKYRVPESLQLYGVYLNDPGQSGLGFHTYMSANIWAMQYFRPIAAGLEGAGTYAAIMEPPDPKAVSVKISPAKENNRLQVVLEVPEKGVSIFIPKELNKTIKTYLELLLRQFRQSPEFATLIEDPYFGEALNNANVNRCYKVAGKLNQDYTIIPFDKKINKKIATTLAVIVNNETGQFQIASADNKASDIYAPMPWYKAYKALRGKIGWNERLVKYWLSNNTGSALFPGWSVVAIKYDQQGPVQLLSTNEYFVTNEGKVNLEQSSPGIEILSTNITRSGKQWIKTVSFKVSNAEKYTVKSEKKYQKGQVSISRDQDAWSVILRGNRNASCRIEVKSGYSTYLYIRR